MAKKADLLVTAKELGLNVTEKNTIAEIQAAIDAGSLPDVEAEIVKEEKTEVTTSDAPKPVEALAKAGKRSAKSLREAEEQAEKEARKAAHDTAPKQEGAESNVKKGPKPVARPMIERRGKNYRNVAKEVDGSKLYSVKEAMAVAVKTSPVKFDASVEIHVRLGVDPRQADQNVRATVALPNGTGRTVRVAVFAPSTDHDAAKKAGADVVGEDDFLAQLDKEELNFDVLIATPAVMPRLGKYARLLGPRGLMPSPKSGTVATDVAKAVTEAKAGKVEYRVDKQSIVHLSVGKVSFGTEKLTQNANAFFESLNSVKPASLKSGYIKTVTIATTMGPGIKVDANSL